MTYTWEKNSRLTSQIQENQPVVLNPAWTGYDFLKKEFGHLFPSGIKKVNRRDGTVTISRGGLYGTTFARQCVTNRRA